MCPAARRWTWYAPDRWLGIARESTGVNIRRLRPALRPRAAYVLEIAHMFVASTTGSRMQWPGWRHSLLLAPSAGAQRPDKQSWATGHGLIRARPCAMARPKPAAAVFRLTSEGHHRRSPGQANAWWCATPSWPSWPGRPPAAGTQPPIAASRAPSPPSWTWPHTRQRRTGRIARESRQRVVAVTLPAARHSVPRQFLQLAPNYRHAIAVDAALSRLYLFENTPKGLRLVADYYASVGKLGIEKRWKATSAHRWAMYFITSRLDPKTLRDFYGAGALPLNYPNPLDQLRGKTGSGIWLHGTPSDQFSRTAGYRRLRGAGPRPGAPAAP